MSYLSFRGSSFRDHGNLVLLFSFPPFLKGGSGGIYPFPLLLEPEDLDEGHAAIPLFTFLPLRGGGLRRGCTLSSFIACEVKLSH